MEPYDMSGTSDISSVIPQGLVETPPNPPEKNVGESQMAEFSTSLDEIVPPGPGMQMQNLAMGQPQQMAPQMPQQAPQRSSKIPFNLTPEQYLSALAGLAAVVAGSAPVQERIASFFPTIEPGSTTAMLITALVAALVFYAAQRFL